MNILESPDLNLIKSEIYHYSNEGVASWYDFAVAINEFFGSKCVINPNPSSAYPLPAKRPSYSVMDKSAIKEDFQLSIRHWQAALKECIEQIKKQ